ERGDVGGIIEIAAVGECEGAVVGGKVRQCILIVRAFDNLRVGANQVDVSVVDHDVGTVVDELPSNLVGASIVEASRSVKVGPGCHSHVAVCIDLEQAV